MRTAAMSQQRWNQRVEAGRLGRNKRGQVSAETAVGMTMVIAAFIGMTVYAQRAIQGNLMQSVESHGQQYDPRNDNYNEQMIEYRQETTDKVTRGSMIAANLVDSVGPDLSAVRAGRGDKKMLLQSLPTGPVLRETTAGESEKFIDSKGLGWTDYYDQR